LSRRNRHSHPHAHDGPAAHRHRRAVYFEWPGRPGPDQTMIVSICAPAVRLPGEGDRFMAQFMLLLRDNPANFAAYSAEDMQAIIQKYRAWRDSHGSRIVTGRKLKDGEGRVMRQNGAKPAITDGPFVESKEIMGGFFVIEADSYDQAVDVASTCPHMQYGSIEVRAVDAVG